MTRTDESVPPLPQSRIDPLRPPDGLAELAAQGLTKVRFPNGVETWFATRYEDVRMVLGDSRFSAYRSGDEPSVRSEPITSMDIPANFNIRDGAAHQHYRLPLSRGFMVKRINAMRPRIQQLVDEHLDAMQRQGPPVDLISALCLPVPSLVIAELLGVPATHRDLFQRTARALLGKYSTMEEFQGLLAEMTVVLTELIDQKRRDGITSDLLGLMANAEEPFPDDELMFLGTGLLAAGHDTTANFMALSVLALFDDPDQRAAFMRDPENSGPAVEELLRFMLPTGSGGIPRRATEDVEVGGQLVRSGEWVTISSYANRDETLCPHAGTLDVRRPTPPHVAFGFGPHQCLGQNLARAELQIMLTSLFTRFPTLQPEKDIRDLPYRNDMLVYGVYELPVVW
ncbi:cytochrome P450 [Pseudonocardia sp.]|uniref:cytochrome P450 n=1 Tax=Pseudonocardia sp. TaxID=60912 RepID=UPI0031FC1AB1